MPSSTDPAWHPAEVRRSWDDTLHLIRFTVGTVRKKKALTVAWVVLAVITTAAILVPALVPGAGDARGTAADLRENLLPVALVGFLALTAAGGIATGGGRQLLASEQSSAFPVSAVTDYFGSVLLAPMSTAWLLQAWFLLGVAAFAGGVTTLAGLIVLIALWIVAATVLGQAVAWAVEYVRRGPGGVWAVRGGGVLLALGVAGLIHAGRLGDVVDAVPTRRLVDVGLHGPFPVWLLAVLAVAALFVLSLFFGGCAASLAATRQPRDEAKVETRHHPARPTPRTEGAMLRRIDRASVWRSVAMRRGVMVLAVGPGLVALVGQMAWENVVILPGLVVSGGVLLFGVNAFSLDGRGGLWRESLPVAPRAVFVARSWVMAEWLLLGSLVTIALAAVRAGTPTLSEAVAVVVTVVVVTVQVVAVAMSWSVRRPYAVNMRSARATPAPPAVMVTYSAKLALSTTMTAMVFSIACAVAPWHVIVALALPFLLHSVLRWRRAAQVWSNPSARATVVTTVAA